jgi:hypothetical protein
VKGRVIFSKAPVLGCADIAFSWTLGLSHAFIGERKILSSNFKPFWRTILFFFFTVLSFEAAVA